MSGLFAAGSLHPSACNASGRDVASVHRCALARLAADGVPRAAYEFRGGRGDALASFQSDQCSHFYDALAPRSRRIADPFVTTVSRSLVVTEDLHPGGRAFAIAQLQPAQEVMVSHDFKVGYVVVRKAAWVGLPNEESAGTDAPAEGRSAFAAEVDDVRVLLRDASPRSLACLDEIGRGT